jgi:hypothetical protein
MLVNACECLFNNVAPDPKLVLSQLNAFELSKVHPFFAETQARSKELLKRAPKRQFSAAETKRTGVAPVDSIDVVE